MDERERQIGLLFADIARFRANLYDRKVNPVGLTYAQAMALNHLMLHDGLTQVEIARRMDLGPVTVSGIIDRLEIGGWVTRKTSQSDRRAKTIWLTDKVDEAKTHMVDALRHLNDVSLQGFSDDRIKELATTLRQVKTNLIEAMSAKPAK